MDLSETQFRGSTLTIADFEEVVRDAFQTWSAVANINFREVEVGEASGFSHIGVRTTSDPVPGANSTWGSPGGIIGYGGILNSERFAWMDAAETWHPTGAGAMNYWVVAAHEIGHAIGLGHDSDGLQLMNPRLGSQQGIYDGDIAAVIDTYGAREWTAADENIYLEYVTVGQTVEAKGGNDTIVATTKADIIHGGAGDDDIAARDGNDKIYDTLGDNIVDGGQDNDLIVGGSGQTDAAGGTGNDILIGGKGDDILDGGSGNDTIRGDAQSSFFHGDDVITAGQGTDYLEGGGGADTFVFRPGDGTNTIAELGISGTSVSSTGALGADFESGIDLIDLSSFGYDNTAEALGKVTDTGGHARFSDQGTVIVFHDLDLSDLSQNNFLV